MHLLGVCKSPGRIPDFRASCYKKALSNGCNFETVLLDDRQITHLVCARLKHDLYDFF